jgi:hypothetical protein
MVCIGMVIRNGAVWRFEGTENCTEDESKLSAKFSFRRMSEISLRELLSPTNETNIQILTNLTDIQVAKEMFTIQEVGLSHKFKRNSESFAKTDQEMLEKLENREMKNSFVPSNCQFISCDSDHLSMIPICLSHCQYVVNRNDGVHELDDETLSDKWIQPKSTNGYIVEEEAKLAKISDFESYDTICMRPDENKISVIDIAADIPPIILESDDQTWISTTSRAVKVNGFSEPNDGKPNSCANEYDESDVKIVVQIRNIVRSTENFIDKVNAGNMAISNMEGSDFDKSFCGQSSNTSAREQECKLQDGASVLVDRKADVPSDTYGCGFLSNEEVHRKTTLYESNIQDGANVIQYNQPSDGWTGFSECVKNNNHKEQIVHERELLDDLQMSKETLDLLIKANIDTSAICPGKAVDAPDPTAPNNQMQQGRQLFGALPMSKETLDQLSKANFDTSAICPGKAVDAPDPTAPNNQMQQGKRLLDNFSEGKVKLKQLSSADIDSMTIALGKTKLKGYKSKQERLQNLGEIMRSMLKLNEPFAENVTMPSLESVRPQKAREIDNLSEIERVRLKFDTKHIAKMLANRVARCSNDIDDMFARIQIMDMLAVTEGARQKPPRLTRTLHELSVDPRDNLSKLVSRMDQFAVLIEQAMNPMNESSLVETGSCSPKSKKIRIFAQAKHNSN